MKISKEEIETWKNNIIKEKEKKRKIFTQPKKEWSRDRCFRDRNNNLDCLYERKRMERDRCYRDRSNKLICHNRFRPRECIYVRDRNKNLVCSYELIN